MGKFLNGQQEINLLKKIPILIILASQKNVLSENQEFAIPGAILDIK